MMLRTNRQQISGSRDVAEVFRTILQAEDSIDQDKEHFWCLGLNTKNRIIYVELVTLGTLDCSLVHPREVFRLAIMRAVSSIILAHNHPSGDTTPSKEDEAVTRRLVEAGKVLGITVLDHVIVGDGYHSFAEHGAL